MSEQWDFFISVVNGKPASTFTNFEYRDSAPVASKPFLLIVQIQFVTPDERGLTSNEDPQTLFAIERVLEQLDGVPYFASYAGRVTTRNTRRFYFYSETHDNFAEWVSRKLAKYQQYQIQVAIEHDPQWRTYRDELLPSSLELQQMRDREILELLEKQGDMSKIARPIDHFFYFPSQASSDEFVRQVSGEGYKVTRQSQLSPDELAKMDDQSKQKPFSVTCVKVQPATAESIDQSSSYLVELTLRLGGDYDGWGTPVKKKPWWKFWA